MRRIRSIIACVIDFKDPRFKKNKIIYKKTKKRNRMIESLIYYDISHVL